jgi:hypothetical protein
MGKEKKPGPVRRKRSQNYRFSPQTIHRLALAARRLQLSKTAYTELALQERFERDGIGEAKPDFEAHFARHPVLIDGGAALQALLKDRE